ncbi:MAG: hypothetical protein Q4C68_06120 [Moraxella sp.]|nr:hypothetical protein [Moraxella sp.]
MDTMRRFIDVIFVEPKHKHYVVLHHGKFWQVPRMALTPTSWLERHPYTGKLQDIFVAQDQAVAAVELANVLTTQELPEQLSGISATRFLEWWQAHDYLWANTSSLIELSLPTKERPKTASSPKNSKPTSAHHKTAALKAKTQTQKKSAKTVPDAPIATKQMPTQTNAKTTKTPKVAKSSKKNEPKDIFDTLLDELNAEVLKTSIH